jgi:Fanconi anemia group J protein
MEMTALAPPAPPEDTSVLIMGHRVAFPEGKSPFPAQLAVMSSVLAALGRKQHALVESPTGSGKTLALLSSCLTFQRDFMEDAMAKYYRDMAQQRQQRLQQQQQGTDQAGAQQESQSQSQSQSQDHQAAAAWDDDAFGLLLRTVKRFRRDDGSAVATTTQQSDVLEQETQQETETQRSDEETKEQDTKDGAVFGPDSLQATEPPKVPKIFFCSRTHSQLAQAVKELNGCPESYMRTVPGSSELQSCVLAAKRMLCVNEDVNDEPMLVNEKCQALRVEKERRRMAGDGEEGGCQYSQTSFSRLRSQAPQVWDIEDVTKLAATCDECAYFFSKDELAAAHIVFCPYNYVLDPAIRKAVGIDLTNAIVVLDEAHNVEDTCRNGASLEIPDHVLSSAVKAFEEVVWQENDPPPTDAYDAVRQMLSCVESWFETNAELVRDPEDVDDDDCHVLWSTEDALEMLRECKLTVVTETDMTEIAQFEQMKLASPGRKVMLGNRALNTAARLISVASYMFLDSCKNADDFKLLITKKMRVNEDDEEVIDTTLCIWCLSASVVFAAVASQTHSVILASGTLSPMDSFAGELGVDFPIRLEANHVVNMRKQVLIGSIMNGPGNIDLISTYKNQQHFQYQDSMGLLLLQYAQVIPGGVLMFFPSYALLGILAARWKRTGVWAQLEKHKKMFCEPRQGGKDFDALLDKYKAVIAEHTAAHSVPSGWTRDGADGDEPNVTGAIFLAVYRGKVSEGIDFSDDNARAVLAVGIPFPNFKDLQVSLKREYQDIKSRADRKLVNGSWWYKLQAFRALNQALGRCIRHRRDYGAVILIDSRHRGNMHGSSLSKWMRPHVQEFWSSEDCNPLFARFFQRNQAELPMRTPAPEPEPAPVPVSTPVSNGPIVLEYEDGIKAEPQTVP